MLENVPAAVGQALRGIRPGLEKIAFSSAKLTAPDSLKVSSQAFAEGQPIPSRFTADGAKVSPPLTVDGVPPEAQSLVLIVEDADSPTPAPLVHALAWDISPGHVRFEEADLNTDAMPPARREVVFGKSSFLTLGWLPPDPPSGHGVHRYAFQVFALGRPLGLAEGTGRSALLSALDGLVIAKGLLIGTYERSGP